jgi:DNA polymerase III alpha subunit
MGMHCGGVVITPGPVTDLVPLQRASRDPQMAITQYDKDSIEALGLVKMDLLGSRALTTLVDSVRSVGLDAGHATMRDALDAIPPDDEATYRLMAEGNTLGCFQLESPGMRGLLKWLRPRNIDTVAAAISLFRPGPLQGGFLETFMRRHLGLEPVSYYHPSMEPILRDTYGVILYQEQFLRLVNELAGVSLGEAEKLRKSLGKARDADERIRLGKEFVAGAIERGIPQLQAEKVWEIVSGYTGFGFCKAHACSYAPTAYRAAYMKTHYPAHYMAAQVNNRGGYYGPTVYLEDARRFHVELLPPHVNQSGAMCSVPPGKRAIRMGLQFVRGLSEPSIAAIVAERQGGGFFSSLPDLLSRVSLRPREIEMLVKAGACDDLASHGEWVAEPGEYGGEESEGPQPRPSLNRRQLLWLLPHLLSVRFPMRPTRRTKEATATNDSPMQLLVGGLLPLLQGDGRDAAPKILGRSLIPAVPVMDDHTASEKLGLEREALGFTVSRNESDLWSDVLEKRGVTTSTLLARHAERQIMVAGVAVAGRGHTCQNGDKMLFLTLQDSGGLIEVVLFPDTYRACSAAIEAGGRGPFLIKGTVQVSGKGRGIGVQPPADLTTIITNLRQSDALAMKMHPVLIASGVEMLEFQTSSHTTEVPNRKRAE